MSERAVLADSYREPWLPPREEPTGQELSEADRWRDYLDALPHLVPFSTAARVSALWGKLQLRYATLPLPIAGPHGEAEFQLAWNGEHTYLDLELSADGTLAWTHLNRQTGQAEGEEGMRFATLSPRFFEHLEAMGAKT